jgi:hypothetical protein
MKGRGFTSRKRAGGFIGLAIAAAGAAYNAYESNKQQDRASEDKSASIGQGFQDNAWLAQQQRQFQLQDRQYKENALRQYAPFYKGPPVADPKLTDTRGLAHWQPNAKQPIPILASGYQYATGGER